MKGFLTTWNSSPTAARSRAAAASVPSTGTLPSCTGFPRRLSGISWICIFCTIEIAVLKRCLRCVLDHRPVDLDLSMFQSFFEKHSGLDLIRLSSAADMQEFVAGLEGSVFYRLLTQLAAGRQSHAVRL